MATARVELNVLPPPPAVVRQFAEPKRKEGEKIFKRSSTWRRCDALGVKSKASSLLTPLLLMLVVSVVKTQVATEKEWPLDVCGTLLPTLRECLTR